MAPSGEANTRARVAPSSYDCFRCTHGQAFVPVCCDASNELAAFEHYMAESYRTPIAAGYLEFSLRGMRWGVA